MAKRFTAPPKRYHKDDTLCPHKFTSRGTPLDQDCPGHGYWRAVCSCKQWLREYVMKVVLTNAKERHMIDAHGQ